MKSGAHILIIGGGLAGLTAAIHLSQLGRMVTLIEKNSFPKHKVCGEFISNEVLPYFEFLGLDISPLQPTRIHKTNISIASGESIQSLLPLGGFGVSRFALDHFLYEKALENGCRILKEQVVDVHFKADKFLVTTNSETLSADIVLGAYGKRANLDQKLQRRFILKKSPWLAVKAHYSGDFPSDLVELHNFKGGYCGVSKVEGNKINICYLANFKTFKKFRDIAEYQSHVLYENPRLKSIFESSRMVFDKPMTISQIAFDSKSAVENHILMIGDTAGLIHPLCGNGMAMAIHSAKIASELVDEFSSGSLSRKELEQKYKTAWKANFQKRMQAGRLLAKLLQNKTLGLFVMKALVVFPSLLPKIISKTHGKPLKAVAYA